MAYPNCSYYPGHRFVWGITFCLLLAVVTAHAASPSTWYAEDNARWFGGRLPKDVAVRYSAHMPNGFWAYTRRLPDGRFVITLERYLARTPNAARLTLLHEMAHIATWGREFNDHGPIWQAEMHRLADAGAFDALW